MHSPLFLDQVGQVVGVGIDDEGELACLLPAQTLSASSQGCHVPAVDPEDRREFVLRALEATHSLVQRACKRFVLYFLRHEVHSTPLSDSDSIDGTHNSNMANSAPVTHQAYSEHCSRVGLAQRDAPIHVQVQSKGVTLCGRVQDLTRFADARHSEWFKVSTVLGTGWFPCQRVRLCSQTDGNCTCEASQ